MENIAVTRLIPCALDATRYRVVLRDLGRLINHALPGQAIAHWPTPEALAVAPGYLPEAVRHAGIALENGQVKLSLALAAGTSAAEGDGIAEELVSELSEFFSHPVRPWRRRVFCVGWEKTGTTSITAAMRRLGFFSWHSCPWVVGITHAASEIPSDRPPDLSLVEAYDFLSDLPISMLYRELDETYPGSLFILTTRPVDSWVKSAIMEINKGVEQAGMLPSIVRFAYGTADIDEPILRQRYIQHQNEVLDYFADRPDLLVIDLTEADPWQGLCAFLGLPVPDIPFPWLNKRTAI